MTTPIYELIFGTDGLSSEVEDVDDRFYNSLESYVRTRELYRRFD